MTVQKIKIGIVASINKMKLPFDMGFNKMEKFFKVTDNKDFLMKMACFLSECSYDQPVARVLSFTIGKNCSN